MDTRPIGVFDSGLGGLTTVKRLSELLPNEDIIYLGDTGRVPYGSRSRDTIIKYSVQATEFLVKHDVKSMVIACNTASTSAHSILKSMNDIPIYEVVSAPAKAAALLSENRRVGVIGTTATIGSGVYEAVIAEIAPDITVFSQACPLFVPLVENGRTDPEDIAALTIAKDYLHILARHDIDVLILGCTHYPLLRNVISCVIGNQIILIDSGAETAKHAADDMARIDILSSKTELGMIKYYVTDSIDGFSELASRFLESDVHGLVSQVTLE